MTNKLGCFINKIYKCLKWPSFFKLNSFCAFQHFHTYTKMQYIENIKRFDRLPSSIISWLIFAPNFWTNIFIGSILPRRMAIIMAGPSVRGCPKIFLISRLTSKLGLFKNSSTAERFPSITASIQQSSLIFFHLLYRLHPSTLIPNKPSSQLSLHVAIWLFLKLFAGNEMVWQFGHFGPFRKLSNRLQKNILYFFVC